MAMIIDRAVRADNVRDGRGLKQGRFSGVFALVKSISLLCLMLRLRQEALAESTHLPFQWQMLITMLSGYTLPVTILACLLVAETAFGDRRRGRG